MLVKNSLIYSNTASMSGGGIQVEGNFKIINSTIVKNSIPSGASGGGINVQSGLDSVLIMNTIFYGNLPLNSNSPFSDIGVTNGKPVGINNYLQDNGGYPFVRLSGNLASNDDPFSDSSNDNYTIKHFSVLESGIASVVLDGTTYSAPNADIAGNSRPNPSNTAPDMGAYESSASPDNTPPSVPTGLVVSPGDT